MEECSAKCAARPLAPSRIRCRSDSSTTSDSRAGTRCAIREPPTNTSTPHYLQVFPSPRRAGKREQTATEWPAHIHRMLSPLLEPIPNCHVEFPAFDSLPLPSKLRELCASA